LSGLHLDEVYQALKAMATFFKSTNAWTSFLGRFEMPLRRPLLDARVTSQMLVHAFRWHGPEGCIEGAESAAQVPFIYLVETWLLYSLTLSLTATQVTRTLGEAADRLLRVAESLPSKHLCDF
jgi:hypothetical protein